MGQNTVFPACFYLRAEQENQSPVLEVRTVIAGVYELGAEGQRGAGIAPDLTRVVTTDMQATELHP